jgi:hypothetical protein
MVNLHLDSTDDENRIDALALHAVRIEDTRWNGFPIPVATAAEFRRFVDAWHRNDPNGLWDSGKVVEADGALIYDIEDYRDVWSAVGVDGDGVALYALDGWTWSAE